MNTSHENSRYHEEKHKKYNSVKTGTRFYVDFWSEGAWMMPQNGGAAFNLTQAQFDAYLSNGSYKEGWV